MQNHSLSNGFGAGGSEFFTVKLQCVVWSKIAREQAVWYLHLAHFVIERIWLDSSKSSPHSKHMCPFGIFNVKLEQLLTVITGSRGKKFFNYRWRKRRHFLTWKWLIGSGKLKGARQIFTFGFTIGVLSLHNSRKSRCSAVCVLWS